MSMIEIKDIISKVVNDHPDHAWEITAMVSSFSYSQLEEYTRVAKAAMGY